MWYIVLLAFFAFLSRVPLRIYNRRVCVRCSPVLVYYGDGKSFFILTHGFSINEKREYGLQLGMKEEVEQEQEEKKKKRIYLCNV